MRYGCLCCLRPDGVAVKVDRKGRPYMTCGWCGARTFLHSPEGLRGVMLLAPTLMHLLAQLGGAGALTAVDAQAPAFMAQAAPIAAAR